MCNNNEIIVAEDSFLQEKGLDLGNLDFNALSDIDVGNEKYGKQNIPSLAEVLDLVRGKDVELQIHIKGNNKDIVRGLVDLLKKKNMCSHVLVTCFDRDFLKELRKLDKEIKIGWLVLPENWKEGKAVLGTDWTKIFKESGKPVEVYTEEEIKEIIKEANGWASVLILHAYKIGKETVETIKKANLSSGAWGAADNLELAKELTALGVQRLTLDNAEQWSKVQLAVLENEKIASALEKRNKENKSNFPADILKEDKILFDKIKALKMPIYSKMDQAIYVWDTDGLEKALQGQYAQGKNDEAMISIITIGEDGWPKLRLAEGGSIWNLAYREDRQRQFADEVLKNFPNLSMFAMTQYVPGLPMDRVVLPDKIVENSLPELLSKNDIPLIWVLDAEKSGLTLPAFRGRKTSFPNEDLQYASISMPVLMTDEQVKNGNFSPDIVLQVEGDQYIAWFYNGVPKGLKQLPNNEYWRYPGLSAFAVTYANINKIKAIKRGCIYTNISLPDLIGHVAIKNINKKAKLFIQNKEGKFEIREGNGWDSVKACLNISDTCIQMIIEALKEKKGKMVLLGDHGSVDDMSQPNHSFNQVPIFIIDTENGEVEVTKGTGTQADAEATVAHFLGIEKPANKTGKSLLPKDYVGNKDAIVLTNLLDGFGHTNFGDPMNAFGVAMKEGLMPTIKGLYDKNNYQLLEASGYLAGLRGGRQKDFSKEDIITTRDGMLKRIEEIKPQAIQIILYDYQDIKGAVSEGYDYSNGLYELQNSPFLNDKNFVIVSDPADNKVKVLCLDYPQMGSTEYNTWSIGALEIVEQSVVLLDKLFISGEIFKTEALKTFVQNAKKEGVAHFSGILQEAAVHSSVRQLYYLIKYFKENGIEKFVFDLASDGRDKGKQDCLSRIHQLRAALEYFKIEDYTLNIRGREICFDRANNMELTGAWINELLYGSRRIPEIYKRLIFLNANSKFFKAVGGEALLPGYLKDIFGQYKVLFNLDDVKLALVVHSSFFKKGGAIEALNEIIKSQPGQIMLGIYGEGADKIRDLFSDNSNIITAKTAGELKSKLEAQEIKFSNDDVVVLKPIGEKIGWEVKQVGFSEKTISTVAVAKAMQVLLGANPEGRSYSGVILNRLKEFYENMKSQKVISNETYEKTKTQVFDGLDLPDIELAQGINGINNNDADVISKFIDSFI